MIRKKLIHSPSDVPENWRDFVVIIWEEDDVNYSDKEKTDKAFERITGSNIKDHDIVKQIDEGDQFIDFFRGGFVKAINCDGGWVGVLFGMFDVEACNQVVNLMERSSPQ